MYCRYITLYSNIAKQVTSFHVYMIFLLEQKYYCEKKNQAVSTFNVCVSLTIRCGKQTNKKKILKTALLDVKLQKTQMISKEL